MPGLGEDGGEQAGEGIAAGRPGPQCRQQVIAVTWPRMSARTAVKGMRPGSVPARAAARAAAVAVMLWMSSSAHASWRASSGDWPRRARRVPRTVFFRWRNAISTCHLSAYRAAISRAGYVSWSSRVVRTRRRVVFVLPLRVRAVTVKVTSRAVVSGSRGAAGRRPRGGAGSASRLIRAA